MATRRDDPAFSQVSGYIPKEIALRFKVACTESEITHSEALEEAVLLWLAEREKRKATIGKTTEKKQSERKS